MSDSSGLFASNEVTPLVPMFGPFRDACLLISM